MANYPSSEGRKLVLALVQMIEENKVYLSEIDAGNDVKARHWSVLRGSGFGRDIAREPLDLQRRYPGGQRRSGRPATKTGGSMMRFIKALTRS